MPDINHVLDAIDGALEDWEVSQDAMRWAPEARAKPVAGMALYTAPIGTPWPDTGLWPSIGWTTEPLNIRPIMDTIQDEIRCVATRHRASYRIVADITDAHRRWFEWTED